MTFQETLAERNIDDAVNILNRCIHNSNTLKNQNKSRNYYFKKQPGWFDKECEHFKNKKFEALNRFHESNLEEDLQVYLDKRRYFKNLCKVKKREFNQVEAALVLENSLKPNSK